MKLSDGCAMLLVATLWWAWEHKGALLVGGVLVIVIMWSVGR
jgi:hypothetical protein